MATSVALIIAKSESKRLPNKNTLPVKGVPMFLVNVKKCHKIFDRTYVSSDSVEMLEQAVNEGAIAIKRPKSLCGDVPNMEVYQHAIRYIDEDIIVAVQANSPTIESNSIKQVKRIIEMGFNEVITCHEDYSIYGSIWALTKDRIRNYIDPYKPTPEVLIVDKSVDVHTLSDYEKIK